MIRTHPTPRLQHSRTGPLAAPRDWRAGLPRIAVPGVVLRELQPGDAASLHAHVATREVSRFISAPPGTVQGFERFIAWARAERQAGRYVCFAVVPDCAAHAAGLFQIRQLVPSFEIAEWGFALGEPFWGTGLFATAAVHIIDFAIETLGVRRLEARSSVLNTRGRCALNKIGAVNEAVLRKAFLKDGTYHDQQLWAINAADWTLERPRAPRGVH